MGLSSSRTPLHIIRQAFIHCRAGINTWKGVRFTSFADALHIVWHGHVHHWGWYCTLFAIAFSSRGMRLYIIGQGLLYRLARVRPMNC